MYDIVSYNITFVAIKHSRSKIRAIDHVYLLCMRNNRGNRFQVERKYKMSELTCKFFNIRLFY